jgi:general secretion pathway protein K
MRAASIAWSPCAEGQRGAAILLAMLTLALVAGVVAAAIADWGTATASLSGRHDQSQARLLARAAADWARNILADDARTSSIDYVGEAWSVRVPPTPAEDGEVSGEIEDLSGRFDINSVAAGSGLDVAQAVAYRRLLTMLGIADAEATAMLAAMSKGPFADVDELALYRGYDGDRMARLRPFLVAAPATAPLNINTASPEVLAALIPALSVDRARTIVGERQQKPFKDVEDFVLRTGHAEVRSQAATLATSSRYFLASVRARYGESLVRLQVMLDRRNAWPEIVWQKIL